MLLDFFFISSTSAPKNKLSVEPCLVSVVVLMRGCSGTGETGKDKIKVHSLQKTRLHH